MGILLIPAAELRLRGADIIVLNVSQREIEPIRDFDDVRRLRSIRGESIFTIAPHPFYVLGGSIGGERLLQEIDCFDAIELCHFYRGLFNPNRRAVDVAHQFGKPLVATSDAHQLHAFGENYTSIPRPSQLTTDAVFSALRAGEARVTNPPTTFRDLISTAYFIFIAHNWRLWQRRRRERANRDLETTVGT